MYANGGHREMYHIGNDEEVSIRDLAGRIGKTVGVDLDVRPGGSPRVARRAGAPTSPRCARSAPAAVNLDDGLERTVTWYRDHRDDVPANELM